MFYFINHMRDNLIFREFKDKIKTNTFLKGKTICVKITSNSGQYNVSINVRLNKLNVIKKNM